jgi:Cupin-like domain
MSLSLDQHTCDFLFLYFLCRQQGRRQSGGDCENTLAGRPKRRAFVMRETLLACPEQENDNDDPVTRSFRNRVNVNMTFAVFTRQPTTKRQHPGKCVARSGGSSIMSSSSSRSAASPRATTTVTAYATRRSSSIGGTNTNMHSILALHYQIQRRSRLEQGLTCLTIACAVLFTTVTCVLYQRIVRLEERQSRSLFGSSTTNNNKHGVVDESLSKARQQPDSPSKSAAAIAMGAAVDLSKRIRKLRYHPPDYPTVRQEFLARHLNLTIDDMHQAVHDWRRPDPSTFFNTIKETYQHYYDVWNCPTDRIPPHYPYAWRAMDVLRHWNPDVTSAPPHNAIHHSLCVFDWRRPEHRSAVYLYRDAEVPFVLRQHDDVTATAYRWSQPNYLSRLLSNRNDAVSNSTTGGTIIATKQRNEHSTNNHFMFWRLPPKPKRFRRDSPHNVIESPPSPPTENNFVPPTDNVELTFDEWLHRAHALEHVTDAEQVTMEHWYFRLNAGLPKFNTYLYDELPMFQPVFDESNGGGGGDAKSNPDQTDYQQRPLFMVDSTQQRGINCRFGMRGVIAEAHFDPTRNWILILSGQRRYILAHPSQCPNLELYPKGHPSGRHSSINWSTIARDQYRNYTGPFAQAMVQEVVLQGGDALYLPTSWFHFIVSLNINYQCNARSGETLEHREDIKRCGFDLSDARYHRS